jgi:opacity protein-like surface antigen
MKIPSIIQYIMVFLLAAGMTAVVRADSELAPQELSVDVGAAFPTGINNFSDSEKLGLVGGAQYLRMLSPNFGWGVQADYYHFAAKNHLITDQLGGQLNSRSSDNVATFEIVGRYSFLTERRLVPYLHSGVGVTYFHQKAEGEPAAGFGWFDTGTTETRQLHDTSSLGFAYSAGFGVDTELAYGWVLGLETAWNIFGVSQTSFGTSAINVPSVFLRLGWRFGQFNNDSPS